MTNSRLWYVAAIAMLSALSMAAAPSASVSNSPNLHTRSLVLQVDQKTGETTVYAVTGVTDQRVDLIEDSFPQRQKTYELDREDFEHQAQAGQWIVLSSLPDSASLTAVLPYANHGGYIAKVKSTWASSDGAYELALLDTSDYGDDYVFTRAPHSKTSVLRVSPGETVAGVARQAQIRLVFSDSDSARNEPNAVFISSVLGLSMDEVMRPAVVSSARRCQAAFGG